MQMSMFMIDPIPQGGDRAADRDRCDSVPTGTRGQPERGRIDPAFSRMSMIRMFVITTLREVIVIPPGDFRDIHVSHADRSGGALACQPANAGRIALQQAVDPTPLFNWDVSFVVVRDDDLLF